MDKSRYIYHFLGARYKVVNEDELPRILRSSKEVYTFDEFYEKVKKYDKP